jgi:hypothetical protein
MLSPRSSWWWLTLTAAWLAAVGAGTGLLLAYKATPGTPTASPAAWPAATRLRRSDSGHRLVLFVHPRCPCTRACNGELARLLVQCHGRLEADVLFFRPAGEAEPWQENDAWRAAAVIPGVRVSWDDGGVEARRFGARTSGHAALYDAAGALRFSGGITPARGHEGDNAGRDAVVALVFGRPPGTTHPPVFGCPLESPP